MAQVSTENLSEQIRKEYFQSGCDRSDLDEAVSRLIKECGDLFSGEESAVSFLHETSDDCEAGIHSWCDEVGLLPPDTKCTACGAEYGNPS